MARKEYARSARTAMGRRRGLPGLSRGTRMRDITAYKADASPALQAVRVKREAVRGRPHATTSGSLPSRLSLKRCR
jgi:hypothetical protein